MATFRVKQHDTTLPLSAETDITGATVTAFIRTMGVKTEIASTVPVNVTDAAVGDFDVIVTDIAYGDFDLEVLVVKDGEEIRIPSAGYHRLLISPNLDDPLAGPYKPSATLDQVIEEKFAEQADRLIPFAETAVEAAAEAGTFAAATEFDANRAGESAFQSGQSAGYALGHRNAAASSAEAAAASAASIGSAISQIGSNNRALDAMVSALDMRDPRPVVIASAGDSTTSPFATGAFMRAWKELAAAVWPDRPFRVFAWGKESNAYPSSPTVWQDAAVISDPGGDTPNSVIAADTFSLNGGDMANRPAEVGATAWSSTAGAYIAQDGMCVANPSYAGGGIPGVTLTALPRVGGDFDYRGEWRISSQDVTSLQRRIRAAINGASGEIRIQATGATTVAVTVTKIIGGTTTTLGTFPAGTIPSGTPTAWYPFQVKLVGTTLTLVLNGQTLTYTLDAGDPAALGGMFGMADNSRNAGIRAFEVRGTVTRPPVSGGPSPLGWATVYNAAVAGSTIVYQQARIAAMYPVQPDVIFIHHGHNYASGTTTPEQFFTAVDGFLAALFAVWAPCPIVIASQNPEFPATDVSAARVARHLAIQRTIRGEAQRRGWGYVPILEAFAARSDGGSSYVQVDGIHPVIGTGTTLQTDTLKAWIKRSSLRP